MKTFKLFLYCLTISIATSYTFVCVNHRFFHFKEEDINGEKPLGLVLIICIAPLIETIIFQYIMHHILVYIKIRNGWTQIVLMSLVFASFHLYSSFYMLMVFCSSIALNFFYIKTSKVNMLLAVLLTALLHSLYNLFGYLFVV